MKLGLLGGFGGYATIDFFRRLLERFSSDTERSYPQVLIDCNFSMPSRTKALLTGEKWDEIVDAIAHSIKIMMTERVDAIVLVCGTAHAFLPDVYKKIPEAKEKVINIIDVLGERLESDKVKQVLIIAAEGTLYRHIYSNSLDKSGIVGVEPHEGDWSRIRYFIEAVKKNDYNDDVADDFLHFISKYNVKDVVLGCTEFPALVNEFKKKSPSYGEVYNFYDPLEVALEKIEEIKKSSE